MLDLAIVHSPGLTGGKHDLGRILEAMLYYDRVHLVIHAGLFSGLWDQLGGRDLETLLRYPSVTSTITPEMVAVANNTTNGITTHTTVAFKLSGDRGRQIPDHDDVGSLVQMVGNNPNRNDATRNQVARIVKLGKRTRYSKILGGEKAARDRFTSLAKDPETLKLFLRGWSMASGKPVNEEIFRRLYVSVEDVGDQFMIIASHPLSAVIPGWDGTSEWGEILAPLQDYAIDLYLSSAMSGDIVTSPAASQIAAARVDLTIQRATRNAQQISQFEEMVFEESNGFAAAINSGLIDLPEALKILDEARKFRTWARGLPPDGNLLAEYNQAISRDTGLKRFPLNIMRFGLFNFAGMLADAVVAPGAGVGLSAIDTFIIDRLAGGWKPNVFVQKFRTRLDRARERDIVRSERS